MQQRQPRLGDILDDYCPRERRLTNHVVVAMIGDEIRQTRCTTCEADHPYKHARAPRPRRKSEPAALYAQVLAGATPKVVTHEASATNHEEPVSEPPEVEIAAAPPPRPAANHLPAPAVNVMNVKDAGDAGNAGDVEDAANRELAARRDDDLDEMSEDDNRGNVEGPVHRTLIRAQLPRLGGQPPAQRPAPDFTIRQPAGRPDRFRPRQARGGQGFQGNRPGNPGNGNGNGNVRGGGARPFGSGRPPQPSRHANQQGHGRKRSR